MKHKPIRALVAILPMLAVAPATAQDTSVRTVEPVFSKQPDWAVEKYGGPGLFFPERADRGKVISGTATIECTLASNGTLHGCIIISETPPSCPFGYAAQNMAERRVMGARPRLVDGQPVDGEVVRVAVAFGHPERLRRPGRCPTP